MLSQLIISTNPENAKKFISNLFAKQDIDPLDITFFTEEGSIGIQSIRNIQKTIFLSPLKSAAKALVIEHAETLTLEAQNALLKLLEEPPAHTHIALLATNKDIFLPTILSRCKVIVLEEETKELSSEEIARYEEMLTAISQGNIGQKLRIAQDLTDNKENLAETLHNLLIIARQKLLEDTTDISWAHLTSALHTAYIKAKTTNINPRFLLEHALLTSS